MSRMLDRIRMGLRGKMPPPPIAQLIGVVLADVEPGAGGRRVRGHAAARSTCMTLRGEQADGG